MDKFVIFLSSIGLLLTVACAHKAEKPAAETKAEMKQEATVVKKQIKKDKSITCLVNKDSRIISLDKKPKRCEVFYTKFGEKAQVAWAEATPSICTNVMQKIRKNIEEKGFKCVSDFDKPKTEKTAEDKPKTAKRDTASQKQ